MSANKGTKKYGLILNSNKLSSSNRLIKNTNVLGDESDGEDDQKRAVNASILQESFKKHQRKQVQLELDRARAEDPTVFEYDSVYDELENRKIARKSAVIDDKKPKYIGSLLKSAELRKREYERMTERKIQKEREAEGSEFQDKEAFVTSRYKEKMLELAKEEERIKQQDKIDELNDVKKQNDLSGFYRHLLNNTLAKEAIPETQATTEEIAKHENIDNSQHQSDQLTDSDNKVHGRIDGRKHERRRRSDDEKHSNDSKHIDRNSDDSDNQTRTNSLKRNIDDTDENETNHRKFRKDNLSGETTEDVTSEEHGIITSKVMTESKTSVFDRRNANDTVSAARERYLARKKEKESVKAIFDDHAN